MNYQNNIDAYYAYAKENHKRRRKEKRATWLWLIAAIMVLLGVWAYLSNLNLLNLLDAEGNSSKHSSSETIPVDNLSKEDEVNRNIDISKNNDSSRVIEINNKNERNLANREMPAALISKKDTNLDSDLNKSNIQRIKSSVNIKEEKVTVVSEAIVKNDDSNSSLKMSPAMALNKRLDINNSLKSDGNTSLSLLKTPADINSSSEKDNSILTRTTLEQNVSVELYHVYIVSKGETIYDIARKEYGDTQMYVEIVNANQDLENPNKIREGQELFLPIVNESKSYSDILHFK